MPAPIRRPQQRVLGLNYEFQQKSSCKTEAQYLMSPCINHSSRLWVLFESFTINMFALFGFSGVFLYSRRSDRAALEYYFKMHTLELLIDKFSSPHMERAGVYQLHFAVV